jgi:hypothetical protein
VILRRWLGVASGLVIAGLAVVYLPDSPHREMDRLRTAITTDLPPGSSPSEIERWLVAREFEVHRTVDKDGRTVEIRGEASRVYFLHWGWGGDLELGFALDGEGNLREAKVEWFETAL